MWAADRGTAKEGQRAGYTKNGYRYLRLNSTDYVEHILMWIYHHGVPPKNCIDHKDRNRLNNHIDNLRDVTHAENMANSSPPKSTGIPGVYPAGKGRYKTGVYFEGEWFNLGIFETPDEAKEVNLLARAMLCRPEAYEAKNTTQGAAK